MEESQAKTQSQNQGGRPTKKTDLILKKLEEAFAWGCTDKEACLYAGISEKTLYNYQAADAEFLQRKELLKQLPILKARSAVVNALEDDPELALKFLERKKKDEFSTKRSSAQITKHYSKEDLVGKQVVCVINFPAKQIGAFVSECLTTGFADENGDVVLTQPERKVPNGTKIF